MSKLRTCLLILSLGFSSHLFGQTSDCETKLSEAVNEFNAGHFYVVPAMLDQCLDDFTKDQRQRAYTLLVATYLITDNAEAAKKCYLQILKANPEFVPDPNTLPIDVVYLGRRFTSRPIFSLFVKAGTNLTPIRVIYDLSAYGNTDVVENYRLKAGYKGAVGGDFYIGRNFSIKTELNYRTAIFNHSTRNYFLGDSKIMRERQSWLGIPVALSYYLDRGSYQPYAYVGYEADLLLKDMVYFNLTKVTDGEKSGTESKEINVTNKRIRINRDVLLGTGIRYKFNLNYIFVEFKYNLGLKNVVKASNLYGDYSYDPLSEDFMKSTDPVILYAHVDDYYRVDNIEMSFGFVRPLYKPREIKLRGRAKKVVL